MSPAAIQLLGEGTETPLPTVTIPETGATVSTNKNTHTYTNSTDYCVL
jgi:hypothetical protein